MNEDTLTPRPIGCRAYADAIPTSLEIHAGGQILKAQSIADISPEERAKLIARVRAGEHLELEFDAITYRQLDGKPNKNFLRFKASRLSRVAKTGARNPFLVDHRQNTVAHRMGTVLASKLLTHEDLPDLAEGETAFSQRIRVVKPDAVIGVLDGTIDRFSIGWSPRGPVTCSVHGGRARRDCACWQGDTVDVDGEEKIVEYEFSDAELVEVSAVNVPAVSGTRIDDVRAALAAEINHHDRSQTMSTTPRLAAILGVAAGASEADLVTAAETLRNDRDRFEAQLGLATSARTTAEATVSELRTQLAAATAAATSTAVGAIVERAYASGRLLRLKDAQGNPTLDALEPMLRRLGELDGPEKLAAHVEAMPVRAPIGQPPIGHGAAPAFRIPGEQNLPELQVNDPALAGAAKQLGLKPDQIAASHAAVYGGK